MRFETRPDCAMVRASIIAPGATPLPTLFRRGRRSLTGALTSLGTEAGREATQLVRYPLIAGRKKIAMLIAKPMLQRIERSVGRLPI